MRSNKRQPKYKVFTALFVATFTCLSGAMPMPAGAEEINFAADEKSSGGIVGAYALDLGSGKTISYHANETFPIASVIKLFAAIAFLKQVDAKKYALADKIHLSRKDVFEYGHSPMTASMPAAGLDLSYFDVMRWALCESDSTAGEILLIKSGGASGVQKAIDGTGLKHIVVKDSEAKLGMAYSGVDPAKIRQWDGKSIRALLSAVPKAAKSSSARKFLLAPGNTATPKDSADLMAMIIQGKVLKPETTSYLLNLMTLCKTGAHRIKGGVPNDVVVGDKTGTWDTTDGVNGATNDVGFINIRSYGHRICLAVYVKHSTKNIEAREAAIAAFAKQAYDRFGQ